MNFLLPFIYLMNYFVSVTPFDLYKKYHHIDRDVGILLDITLTMNQEASLGFLMTSTETMILAGYVFREFLNSWGYAISMIDLEKTNAYVGNTRSMTIPKDRLSSNPQKLGKP